MSTILPQHSTLEGASLTTHEHVRFPNGDHVIVHTLPGGVQVTGMVGGEYVEYAGSPRDAREQAQLLETDAPDALWSLPSAQARRIATAMDGAAGVAASQAVSEDDSPECMGVGTVRTPNGSERVAMDGGHADVEAVETAVELTVTLAERAVLGIALSPAEARRIGEALVAAAHRAHVRQAAQVDLEGVETVTDLFHRSQATGIPTSALFDASQYGTSGGARTLS